MKTLALLTDFGLADSYVGVIKAVLLKINPRLRLVDICHNIPACGVTQAAFLLKGAYHYFTRGTIFLVVVDPGVGSSRNSLIIRSKNYFFVGPDNGVLTAAATDDGITRIVKIENEKYFLQNVSSTFHGRDIFAPVAAYLSRSINLGAFGRDLKIIQHLNLPRPSISRGRLSGEVIYIDRFGNLITNIDRDVFQRFSCAARVKIKIKNKTISGPVSSYQTVAWLSPLAIFGSFGHLEISLNQGNAQEAYQVALGQPVMVLKNKN